MAAFLRAGMIHHVRMVGWKVGVSVLDRFAFVAWPKTDRRQRPKGRKCGKHKRSGGRTVPGQQPARERIGDKPAGVR